MSISVTREVLTVLRAEAARVHPVECCGILLGEGDKITRVLPAGNTHPSPEAHFEIDPQTLIDAHRAARQGGPQVVGYYHSHPIGLARPSPTDEEQRSGDGRIWAIVDGAGDTAFWRDEKTGFAPLPHVLTQD